MVSEVISEKIKNAWLQVYKLPNLIFTKFMKLHSQYPSAIKKFSSFALNFGKFSKNYLNFSEFF